MRGASIAIALAVLASASCGPKDPVVKTSTPTAPSASAAASTAGGVGASVPDKRPVAPSGTSASSPAVEMKPVFATKMGPQLREIGIDPSALPPLAKLDPKTLRDVMNTFNRALGVKCTHCHERDFKAPTRNKKVATHMWDDFTRALALEGEGTLYCDSCHAGRPRVLDRNDQVAVADYMQEHYVDHVKRADKKDHSCETCHGEPFEARILDKRWR